MTQDPNAPLNILRFGQAKGTPVFLIHGFTGDAQRWVLIEEAITAHHQMIAVEMPGHGASPKRSVPSFEALAAEVCAAFDALKLQRAHIVGHSLGGAVAMALADMRPDQCASLTLLAPAGLGPKAAGEVLKGLATSTAAADLKRNLQALVHDPALITDDFLELAVELRADPELRSAQDAIGDALFPSGLVAFDMAPVLARLCLPTQIIWGREDRILDWDGALRAPGEVALHIFDAMGHIPQIEAPEAVARLLLRHFKSADMA